MKKIEIDGLLFEPLFEEEQIQKRVRLMGIDISRRYEHKLPVFIGVLNGCFMFMADLLKQIDVPCEMSFIKLASYIGTGQSELNELLGLGIDLEGRDVIIVEDIVDSGHSLKYTLDAVKKLNPAGVIACALLVKPEALQYHFEELTYVGFEISKEFVVGYGMDFNGLCRNLPDIYKNVAI
ncbi:MULTISPECIES: phosphoribosyltransferase [Sphingobacterium]|uniref:phosphoribosyltransferase n=1 Tax=Sphingobacterium TaxID=28453 RepID=UPI0008A44260|nr:MULTISPECIES: phosphoribosyltransferase family protein [Sphingobacterium]OFV09054.1 hypoxanthine phosphoribosyltransferase [Sphingobacterium sp. HMSC13C05]HAK28881.1 hypoxanthine phosphoribosyltransferase [Sphingobacterium sp.]HBI89402.1 hypoxanthine phosphoribosyltransferase [Sphingobacterium sp.]